jgi:hypothetical protein
LRLYVFYVTSVMQLSMDIGDSRSTPRLRAEYSLDRFIRLEWGTLSYNITDHITYSCAAMFSKTLSSLVHDARNTS